MKNKYLIEKLSSIRNEMSHLWGGSFVMGGGAITLAITSPNILKSALAILGLVMTVLFMNAYFLRKQEILNILNELKQEDK